MAIKKIGTKFNERHNEWYEQWEADYEHDLSNLPRCNPGSTCVVKETGKTVTVSNNGVWGGSWDDLSGRPFYKESGMIPLAVEHNYDSEYDFPAVENLTLEAVDGDIKVKGCYVGISDFEQYKVVWDGVEYDCVRYEDPEEYFHTIGAGDAAQPFKIFAWDGAWMGIRIYTYDANGEREVGTTSHTVSVYSFAEKVVTIPSEYLPKAEAVYDVSSAPTAEQFNALLKSLRDAGYMAEQ